MIGISIIPITIIVLDLQQNVFDNFLFDYFKEIDFKLFLFLLIMLFLKSLFTYL